MAWGGRKSSGAARHGHDKATGPSGRRQLTSDADSEVEQSLESLRAAGADIYPRNGIRLGPTLRRTLGYAGFGRSPGVRLLKGSRPGFRPDLAWSPSRRDGDHPGRSAQPRSLYGILVQAASPWSLARCESLSDRAAAFAGALALLFRVRIARSSKRTWLLISPIRRSSTIPFKSTSTPRTLLAEVRYRLEARLRGSRQSPAGAGFCFFASCGNRSGRNRPIQIHLWGGDGGMGAGSGTDLAP